MIRGVDTTKRALTGAALANHGYAFVCRYVENAPTRVVLDKQMTAAEVREKSAAGVRIVSNWEWAPSPTNTVAEGRAHARDFLAVHAAVGGPDWAPCYYSVDTAAKAGAFDNYAHGWADELGPERCGVYGDGALYRALKAAGLVTLAWQSMSTAFPGNNDTTGADIIQHTRGTIDGFSVDFDTAESAYYGGWLLGEPNPLTPPEVDDMSGFTLDQIAHACAAYKNPDDTHDVDMHQHGVDGTKALAQSQANARALVALGTRMAAIETDVAAIAAYLRAPTPAP